ncbi:MAG: matrixin family metalloprotease, partial [Sulfuriferula sp.]
AAYGKMDMLSVLLHEYGHALGIDHNADQHNYMGTTLTPGVRRLPSAEELALMQQLISDVKVEMAAVSTQGSGNTPTQLPLIPLGGFGLAFLGRLRSSRYGSSTVMADYSTLVTQYAVTANAKLTNGTFTVANGLPVDNGWATQGSVDFTGSKATLQEVTTSQTRLNQVFAINPRDRFLSFTLSGSALDDVTGAPDDAFEVALLDANTGKSLLGGTGLSHSDAFLNIQARTIGDRPRLPVIFIVISFASLRLR